MEICKPIKKKRDDPPWQTSLSNSSFSLRHLKLKLINYLLNLSF